MSARDPRAFVAAAIVRASSNGGEALPDLRAVTVGEFVAVDEAGAEALLGDAGEALIPEDGDVMFYGDGGAGKTTLAIDLAFHLAAGDDWLGVPVARPLRVLLVENEGPRPLFRAKIRRKFGGWGGSPLDDRLQVIDAPWAQVSFDDSNCREKLAALIRGRQLDLVIIGPVTRSGMNEAGTLQEVRDFMGLVAGVRRTCGRHVTFALIHHENKGGRVSGAWEGASDTLLRVTGAGRGRTRLYIQKARWASAHHATTLQLRWTEGEGFELEERHELTVETMIEALLTAAGALPGASWSQLRGWRGDDGEKLVRGNAEQLARIRDRLLADGRLVNDPAAPPGQFRLWSGADPVGPRSELGTGLERLAFRPPGEHAEPTPVPRSRSIGNGERGRVGSPGDCELTNRESRNREVWP